MDHKKITLNPEDLKKLQALLRKEEEAVDALSDAEVLAAEKALEQRIKNLPQMKDGSQSNDDELIHSSWQKLQKQLNPSTRAELNQTEKGNVLAFTPKKKSAPWATVGVLAAAALALLVFYPALRQGPSNDPTDFGQQTKGMDNHGLPNYSSGCDVDLRARMVTPGDEDKAVDDDKLVAEDGGNFEVDPKATFYFTVKCRDAGYVHVWTKNPPGEEVRDSSVPREVLTPVIENNVRADFTFEGAKSIQFVMALTDQPVTNGPILFDTPDSPTKIGNAKVLWIDSFVVREKQ
ncbi:MAG: hypothetical protein V4655_12785 [Bdellovibrionota bacterium]